MDHFQVEGFDGIRAFQGEVQAAGGVFAEHQVLPVGQGEGLFVRTFYGGLYGGAESGFDVVDQVIDGQAGLVTVQCDQQLRAAALTVGRGDDAVGAAEPGQHVLMPQRCVAEVIKKLLLNQLPGECSRARAG